jgi:hypothetical protein
MDASCQTQEDIGSDEGIHVLSAGCDYPTNESHTACADKLRVSAFLRFRANNSLLELVGRLTNHRRPNLSEILPKRMIEIATHIDQMMENKLALSLGPIYKRESLYLRFGNVHTDICIDRSNYGGWR